MPMRLSSIGEAALRGREGRRLKAYRDSVGVWTIGDGFTTVRGKPVTKGMTITDAECDALFLEQMAGYLATVERSITMPLADHQVDALASICWNIGKAGFAGSTFVKLINARSDAASIRDAIMRWRKPAEIISRREAEADQFATAYQVALPRARSVDKKRIAVASQPARPVGPHPATTAPAIVPVRLPPATGWLARMGAWFDGVWDSVTPVYLAVRG